MNVNDKQEKGSEAAAHLGDFNITELCTYKEFKMREDSECEPNWNGNQTVYWLKGQMENASS